MTDVLGKEPPTPDLNPMSLAEDRLFRSMVEGAGFVSVEQATSTYPFDLGTEKYMQFRCGTLPLKQKFDELDCWAQAESAFWAACRSTRRSKRTVRSSCPGTRSA